MKKIICVLVLLFSCYIIYNLTIDKSIYYLSIGDGIAKGLNNNNKISSCSYSEKIKNTLKNEKKLNGYNIDSLVDENNRITDILNMIKYKEEIYINDKVTSIHELLKKADIITISLGMNELYYKLLVNNDNIYSYINEMLFDMEKLLNEIKRYNHIQVIVLGYYNTTNNNKDIFNYINYKLEKIVNSNNYEFINLDKVLDGNDKYIENNQKNFYLNDSEYCKISQIIVEKLKKS